MDRLRRPLNFNVSRQKETPVLIYRPKAELTGKRLSAHTIASFMAAQGSNRPEAVASDVSMREDLLRFLLRERTITYWKANGWLKADPFGTELRLTTDGRRKVEGRLAGEPKAQAVTAPQVLEALQVISGALREEPLDSFRLQITQPDRLTDAPRTPEIETASVEVTPTDERLLQAIWTRRGQADFRAKLLLAYGGRCAITDCGAEEALEAAHVFPFAEDRNYELSNGILMRADMHTLFDLFLLSIEPKTTAVWLAPGLLPHYGELHSRIVKFPKDPSLRPDAARLEHHFEQWKIRWQPAKS